MIPGRELVKMMAGSEPRLVITPMINASQQISEGSVDIRLGPDIIVSRRATGATAFDAADGPGFRRALRARQQYVRRSIGDPFHLQPGEFVIARSLEYVSLPRHVSAEALGRSSLGRLGLVIATATLIQPGFKGTITLELTNLGNTPLVLQVGLAIAQLVFRRDEQSRRSSHAMPSKGVRQRRAANRRAERWWAERPTEPGRYEGQLRPELSRLDTEEDLRWIAPTSIKYVIGIVGERYAGKSTVMNFLVARRQFRLFRLSQFVYEEALRRGVDPSIKENLRSVGADMRETHGPDVLARKLFFRIRNEFLDADRQLQQAPIVIMGFRDPEELAAWQRLAVFRSMVVTAPDEMRLERFQALGRTEDHVDAPPFPSEASPSVSRHESDRSDPQEGESRLLQARLDWFRAHIDADRSLIGQARTDASSLELHNKHSSVSDLYDDLKLQVRRLERWWRTQV